ncbi:hypothetical protein Sphch_0557 [Sphingobium chlorophenolicum L-1]|uniref:Putative Flp pilus-assembly TadG-like N-terminal domain-containing protein n=1 Tax=Sphingobium chlorophenolicum L-1 TaxID=690566 RepID=F6EXX0_SPHCR|nr:TadE/TadG family type IV pilus assembly protein [Sphingobium chlorophenolicum]AEG48252.1 hypothetical protein Sphch_0557 [Sphingobium chlorophenolicum L-1]
MGDRIKRALFILMRLYRNQAGNTLAIVAAAMLPLAGMVGGALDISRGYLAKTRLQQACDAGVLAGRKVMGSSGVLSDSVRDEVRKYVSFNYPSGYLGSTLATTDINPTLGSNDQIALSLTTAIPTAVMRLFGRNNMSITASCTARNDYSNIDIVLVLDTTGSMACKPERNDSDCSTWAGSRYVTQWVAGLGRDATFVPEEMNSGVNVSRMQGLRTALANLQSQMATIETQFNMTEESKRKRVRWAIVPFSQMVNAGFSQGSAGTTLYSRHSDWFNRTGKYYNSGYIYDNPTHSDTWLANTWDGCVEERRTSNAITLTSGHSIPNNLPNTADDLKFDSTPTDSNTRWTVADPTRASGQYACPKAMRELQQMTATDFNNYFTFNNGFIPNGGTWLDVGLLWAARLLSRDGLWSTENDELYHTYPVSRYVIFMTDGYMSIGSSNYAAYAQEDYWRRVAAAGASKNDNHYARMLMTCTAIKNMDTKIYTISFGAGSTLDSNLINCSSSTNTTNPEFAYKADSSSDLNRVFRDIGENIGSLRLSQ